MKPKNYTNKSAMLVGTDADPVTAGPKYFAENTPEQEKENAESSSLEEKIPEAVCTTTKTAHA